MNIGDRIKYFRKLKGLTQKQLGYKLGFSNTTAEVRVTQYERGIRKPKGKLIDNLADALYVNKMAISIPEINDKYELFHLLFALDDEFGISVSSIDYELCLTIDPKNDNYEKIYNFLKEWLKLKKCLENNEITEEYFNYWKYNYPDSRIKETQRQFQIYREKSENNNDNI